ncbi:MAG: ROK family transcriptional regulator [Chthoniobacterales bacterium]
MARPSLIRHINQSRVLRLLKDREKLSRAELARCLSLTRSTLTFVTGQLMDAGLVTEAGESSVAQATGRPGTALKLNPDGAFFLGAEIAAEHIHLVLVNLEGSIMFRETAKLRSRKPESVCEQLVQMVEGVWSGHLASSDRLRGVGVTVSALVNTQGVIRIAPTFGWHRVDLRGALKSKLNIPVFVDNDANGAALAELSFGRRVGQSDLCLLFLDVGVGAGMIFNRKLFRGSEGLAGEIGHLTLDPVKNAQAEGKGAIETQLGRDGLLTSYRRMGGGARNLEAFLRDLRKEKPLAQKAVRRWGEWLTLAIGNLADLFNPQLVVLAGPLSELFPFVEEEVKIRLQDRSFPTVESLEIEVSSFGKDGSALGGAALVYDQILSVPDSNFLEDLDLNETAIE